MQIPDNGSPHVSFFQVSVSDYLGYLTPIPYLGNNQRRCWVLKSLHQIYKYCCRPFNGCSKCSCFYGAHRHKGTFPIVNSLSPSLTHIHPCMHLCINYFSLPPFKSGVGREGEGLSTVMHIMVIGIMLLLFVLHKSSIDGGGDGSEEFVGSLSCNAGTFELRGVFEQ